MNSIISAIHSGVRMCIIVAPSPNIISMYFKVDLLDLRSPGGARSALGRSGRAILDTRPRGNSTPNRSIPAREHLFSQPSQGQMLHVVRPCGVARRSSRRVRARPLAALHVLSALPANCQHTPALPRRWVTHAPSLTRIPFKELRQVIAGKQT
jgi:hypothetical protein